MKEKIIFYSPVTGETFLIDSYRTFVRGNKIRYVDDHGNTLVDSKNNPLEKITQDKTQLYESKISNRL